MRKIELHGWNREREKQYTSAMNRNEIKVKMHAEKGQRHDSNRMILGKMGTNNANEAKYREGIEYNNVKKFKSLIWLTPAMDIDRKSTQTHIHTKYSIHCGNVFFVIFGSFALLARIIIE